MDSYNLCNIGVYNYVKILHGRENVLEVSRERTFTSTKSLVKLNRSKAYFLGSIGVQNWIPQFLASFQPIVQAGRISRTANDNRTFVTMLI